MAKSRQSIGRKRNGHFELRGNDSQDPAVRPPGPAGRPNFYEIQQEGLGDEFQESIFSDVDQLMETAGIHRVVFDHHRRLATRFPFAIYYTVEEAQTIIVWRILDLRQDPKSIDEGLES